MTKYINHDLRVNDGKTVSMPPYDAGQLAACWGNLLLPDMDNVFGVTLDTVQQYPIGTKLEMGDRVFRYVEFGDDDGDAVTFTAGYGRLPEHGILMSSTLLEVGTVMRATAAGVTSVLITEASVTVNQFAGGYITVQTAGGKQWYSRIISNTVADASNYVTVVTEAATPIAFTSSDTVSINKNPWKEIVRHSGASAHMGAAVLGVYVGYEPAASEGLFGWIQTWGPALVQISTSHQGDAHGERVLVANNGAAQCTASTAQQIIGFYMQEYDGTTLSLPLVWLTLAH